MAKKTRTHIELRQPEKKSPLLKIIGILVAVIIIVAVLLIALPKNTKDNQNPDENISLPQPNSTELKGAYAAINPYTLSVDSVDFLIDPSLKSTDLNIMGVGIGDTVHRMKKLLGEPDQWLSFTTDISQVNAEYRFKSNSTALLVILKDDRVVRMTFYPNLPVTLKGNSSFIMDKTAIYNRMGLPEETRDMAKFRRFIYDDRGIEVLIKAKDHFGTSLFVPNTTQPREVGQMNVTIQDQPSSEIKV